MEESTEISSDIRLLSQVEALLFVASGPVSPHQISEILNLKTSEIEAALKQIQSHYQSGHGIRLQWHAGKIQLTSAPEYALEVEQFLGIEMTSRLSRAALETMVIIAYKQPITRPGIEAIRGVNSDGVVRSILSKGLIEEIGRSDGPGRPILYGTTSEFLHYFGLANITELPELTEDVVHNGNANILKE